MREIAVAIGVLAVSLAAICFALLAISIPNGNGVVGIPWSMRLLLSATGTVLLICAAFSFDWTVDSFSNKEWDELDSINESMGEKKLPRTLNYFPARARLFGGGYMLICISLSIFTFCTVWIVTYHLTIGNKFLEFCLALSALSCGLAVFVKMMTRRIHTIVWSLILISLLATISILLNFISLKNQ